MATNFVQKGEVLGITESLLTHPTHSDGLVDGGDQVVRGALVGVALESAKASTDDVAVVRDGEWDLPVTATNASGNSAVAIGDQLYISASTAALTKNSNHVAFGIAMEAIGAGETATINVLL